MMKKHFTRRTDWIWITLPALLLAFVVIFSGSMGEKSSADEIEEVDQLIDDFQTAYSNQEVSTLRTLFFGDAVIAYDFENGERQRVHSLEDWLSGTQENVFDVNESISDNLTNREIEVFRNIAYVVCDYRYEDDDEIGIGVDIFTAMKMRGTWKILSLQFTGDEVMR